MTPALVHFLAAEAWCALLVLALIGWGCPLLKSLTGSVPSLGLAACTGLALVVLVLGLLNLLHLVFAPALIALTLAGAGLALWHLPRSNPAWPEFASLRLAWGNRWRWSRLALIAFALLFAFRLAGTPRVVTYHMVDDIQFYLAVPVKMMAVHSVAPDPYSERRIVGGVGGSYLFQGMVLCALPLENVQMADQFVGLVLTALVVLALARQLELSPLAAMLFAFFSLSIPPTDRNLTFSTLTSSLFLALALIATARAPLADRPARQALLIGLIAGTECALKAIFLPHIGLFCLALYFLLGRERSWAVAFRGWCFIFLGALLILAPLMIATRLTCGTFLFPILGHGFDLSAYHLSPPPPRADPVESLKAIAPLLPPLLLILFVQVLFLRRSDEWRVLFSLTLACLLGMVVVDLTTGGDSARRYNLPILIPTLALSFLQLSRERFLRPQWRPGPWLQSGSFALLLGASALMEFGPGSHGGAYTNLYHRIETSLAGPPMDPPQIQQTYARLSAALPKDGLILTTLERPYLLTPLDGHILLADWPGCAGLPPGWPIARDGETLAHYLLSHSIRYVAYTYVSEDRTRLFALLNGYLTHAEPSGPWVQVLAGNYLRGNEQYLELSLTRQKIYDDGQSFILDLSKEAAPP